MKAKDEGKKKGGEEPDHRKLGNNPIGFSIPLLAVNIREENTEEKKEKEKGETDDVKPVPFLTTTLSSATLVYRKKRPRRARDIPSAVRKKERRERRKKRHQRSCSLSSKSLKSYPPGRAMALSEP